MRLREIVFSGGPGGIVPIVKNHLLTQSINRKGSMALPITQMQD